MTELRKLRKERGFSQSKLAAIVGIAATTLSDYERGRKVPSLASAIKLADGLKCSLDMLVGRTGA